MSTGERQIRRGAAAVEAAIEEFELLQRTDDRHAGSGFQGGYDLSWVRGRIDAARNAAHADVVTADEALDWLAGIIGRELPSELDEDEWRDSS